MNSSGIKRGLAATAISALAITGVPLLSGTAYADSIDQQQASATAVRIYTQDSGFASVQNDGVNSSVHLLAGAGADVNQVRFTYPTTDANGVVTNNVIATVSRTNGVFSTEWTPPASVLGQNVTITATGLNLAGTAVAGAPATATAQVSADRTAVDIANAAGSNLGVFRQLYGVEAQENAARPAANGAPAQPAQPGAGVSHDTQPGIVTGTSSGDGVVTLSDRSTGSRIFPDALARVTPGAATNGVRNYRGAVNFSNYTVSSAAGAVNEAIVGAQQAGGSDDAEVVNLQSQAITTVTAAATNSTVNQGQTTSGVVTVTDAQGRPLAGAQVIKDTNRDGTWDGDGADNLNGTADDEISSYTNALGQSTFAGLAGSAAGTTYDFYVNVDGDDAYQADKDFRRSVTVTSQVQTTTALTATSADGAAFDTQEYAAGDISVQVNDQNGAGVPNGTTVSYTWTFTPAATAATPNPTPVVTTGTAPTATPANGGAGRATIGAPSNNFGGDGSYVLNAYIESNGTPGQQTGDLAAAPLTVKAGDSTLAFSEAPTATSVSGSTDTYDATLRLFDGTALAGRSVAFTYGRAAGGNSVVATAQPTGTTRNGDGTATGTTNASGTASVSITDPATPDQAEQGNTLNAQTATNAIGNAAETAVPLTVDFVDGTPPANSTVTVASDTVGKPGTATSGTATVTTDADNNPATPATSPGAGFAVTLTVSGGAFFTDGVPTGGAAGSDATVDNDGQTKTFVTNAAGQVTFQTSIGRDAGFDDDGAVTVNVTAAAGTVTGTDTQVFNSNSPLNGGEVQLVQSPASEQDNPTDPTRVGNTVAYDVFTTDQFGNRVGGENVTVAANGDGFVNFDGQASTAVQSDFDDDGDFVVGASDPGTVTLTATWSTPTTRVVTAATSTTPAVVNAPRTGANETLTDTETEVFNEVDFANATYTITSSPEGNVPVGTAVTEAVTVVDQNGNPVSGLVVRFIRSGPGQQDGDANVVTETNTNGQAFYSFAGTQAGTAQISAVVSDFDNQPVQTLTDSVVFVGGGTNPEPGTDPVRANVTARVSGPNNGATQDRIVVSTTTDQAGVRADGAEVRIYKIVNGRKQQLGGKKRLSDAGRAVFNRADKNGNGVTRYTATVRFTADTKGANSNTVGLR